jgi:outer membrane protein assembly factor BamB
VIEDGVDCWGPMALVGGRLIVRDMTRMVCLDVAAGGVGIRD